MKRILILLACVAIISSCDSTNPTESTWKKGFTIVGANDSSLSDSLKSLFRSDAEHLALREIQSDQNSKNSLVEIPENLIDIYYNSLLHIYNRYNGISGEIGIVSAIHSFPQPETHSIIFAFDSTKSWTFNFVWSIAPTGNKKMDAILLSYGLKVKLLNHWQGVAVVSSEKALNMLALSNQLKNIDGIKNVKPNGVFGDGSDIQIETYKNRMDLTYYFRWGDCPAGCGLSHFWKFQLDRMGNIKFIGEGGDPIYRTY